MICDKQPRRKLYLIFKWHCTVTVFKSESKIVVLNSHDRLAKDVYLQVVVLAPNNKPKSDLMNKDLLMKLTGTVSVTKSQRKKTYETSEKAWDRQKKICKNRNRLLVLQQIQKKPNILHVEINLHWNNLRMQKIDYRIT